MLIRVNIGRLQYLRDNPRALGLIVRPLLEAATVANRMILRTHKVPPLYHSGVRYAEEPPNTDEEFALIPVVNERKWGDCDDLATWRAAELREQGDNATIRITWQISGHRKLYHVLVRHENGAIEDPSKILGMGR